MTFLPGQSGNPSGRPRGAVNRQLALLREAVEKILPLVVERAMSGDVAAQQLILERGLPRLKPVEAEQPEASTQERKSYPQMIGCNAYLNSVMRQ